jgi:predicted  nucleic acid-binding Zn-ribbon protein
MSEKIDIASQLDILIKLQEIDAQIYRLNAEKRKKPQVLAQLKEDFQSKATGVKKAEEKFTALQLKKKEKEGSLQVKEDNIKKLQGQLYQIKTNKEYTAMQKEIEGHKVDKSVAEDEILALMEEIDNAKKEIAKEKEILFQEEIKIKEQEKQVSLELEEIERKLKEFDAQRQTITPQVNADALKKYDKILLSKGGLAIAQVVNGSCQGCYMHLPPQMINEIRIKEKFILCENCNRFLYTNDAL